MPQQGDEATKQRKARRHLISRAKSLCSWARIDRKSSWATCHTVFVPLWPPLLCVGMYPCHACILWPRAVCWVRSWRVMAVGLPGASGKTKRVVAMSCIHRTSPTQSTNERGRHTFAQGAEIAFDSLALPPYPLHDTGQR